MQTNSGILKLGKKEQEALEIVKRHILTDINYGWGGTFGGYEESNKREEIKAEKEIEKARLGLRVIDFILKITE